jgi:hypothetical protein
MFAAAPRCGFDRATIAAYGTAHVGRGCSGTDGEPGAGVVRVRRSGTCARVARAAATLVVVASSLSAIGLERVDPAGAAVATDGDAFSAVVQFRTADGMFAAPIHGAVMPDGRLFLLGVHADSSTPDESGKMHAAWIQPVDAPGAALHASTTVTEIGAPADWHQIPFGPYTLDDSLVCGGHTFLKDGRLMVAGGPKTVRNTATGDLALAGGVNYGTAFDGTSWTRLPGTMAGKGAFLAGRWYPTLTRLADGRVLVTGGFDLLVPLFDANLSEEIFDPADGSWRVISTEQQTPAQTHDADYTAVFQLPARAAGSDVVMIGEDGVPIFLDTSTTPGTWRVSAHARPGATNGAAYSTGAGTAMLPLRLADGDLGYHNGSFVTVSGQVGTTAMSHADIFDPMTDQWRATIDTGVARHYAAPVVLPDGRVLLINGHDTAPNAAVLAPQYLDPRNGFSVSTSPAVSTELRGYHNVAMLLPDGRVLVAGGRDIDRATSSEKPDYAYFSPSYLTKPRPVLTNTPNKLAYGQAAFVGTGNRKPTEAVLMALPAMTHSFDQNQRSIQVKLQPLVSDAANNQISVITAPADANLAPPGDYMLFVLDADRVPSVAKIIRIG